MNTPTHVTDAEIEARIRQWFNDNVASLKLEGGHALSGFIRDSALNQVLMYWRKLHEVALHVTDTEVKLTLPGNLSPSGRQFAIEGVVDIVQEDAQTTMYDLKTHKEQAIRGNLADYEDQLNVYAHIWQNLRGQALDAMTIICSDLPDPVQRALREQRPGQLENALARWNPLIDVPCNPQHVGDTVQRFGAVVDQIESHEFAPPSVETLNRPAAGTQVPFGTAVCRNCDARFSCASYRAFIRAKARVGVGESHYREYVLQDFGEEEERDARRLIETPIALRG